MTIVAAALSVAGVATAARATETFGLRTPVAVTPSRGTPTTKFTIRFATPVAVGSSSGLHTWEIALRFRSRPGQPVLHEPPGREAAARVDPPARQRRPVGLDEALVHRQVRRHDHVVPHDHLPLRAAVAARGLPGDRVRAGADRPLRVHGRARGLVAAVETAFN